MINGSCGGGHFFLGTGNSKKCEEILIEVRFSSAEFTVGDWASVVRGNWVYDRIAGPAHRLDVSLRARGGVAARHLPHGLVGQAFASTEPRHGRVDEYPASGTFRTSAMAEGAAACAPHRTSARRAELRCRTTGAIEGEAAMYEQCNYRQRLHQRLHRPVRRFSRLGGVLHRRTDGQVLLRR